jgi:hypothetical protein
MEFNSSFKELNPNKMVVISAETSLNIGQTALRHVLPADLHPCALLAHTYSLGAASSADQTFMLHNIRTFSGLIYQ